MLCCCLLWSANFSFLCSNFATHSETSNCIFLKRWPGSEGWSVSPLELYVLQEYHVLLLGSVHFTAILQLLRRQAWPFLVGAVYVPRSMS